LSYAAAFGLLIIVLIVL